MERKRVYKNFNTSKTVFSKKIYFDLKTYSYNWFIPKVWQPALKLHIDTNHPEHGEKKFFCNICPKSFIYKSSLSHHIYQAHKNNQQRHMCELCGQDFQSKYYLKEHILKVHPLPGATDFVCDICGLSTSSKGMIIQSLEFYSGGNSCLDKALFM